jgi:hypothetical protein
MELKMRMSKVIGELVAYIFLFMMLFLSILIRIQPILMKIINIVFDLIIIIRNLSLELAYRALPMLYKLKFKLAKGDLLIYYRMISPWSKKDLVIKDPKATYENNHLPIATYRSAENTLLRQEENIIKKYQDSIDGGSYSKYELFSIATQYNEDLKDVQEKIKLVSAAILRLEKKNPENFINLK